MLLGQEKEETLTFTKPLKNSQNQNQVSLFQGKNILVRIIHWINSFVFDPQTGEILEFYEQPTGKTDAVAAQHDVDYSVCEGKENPRKCKNKADRKMVKSLDSIPWEERRWGHWLARNVINTKQKLGLGAKNVKRR